MDYAQFSETLKLKLINRGYRELKIMFKKYPFFIMGSSSGESFIALLVADINEGSEDYHFIRHYLEKAIDSMGIRNFHKNVLIVNLLISDSDNPFASETLDKAKPFEEGSLMDVFWWLRLDSGEIINNKIQPSEVDYLRRDIISVLDGSVRLEDQKEQAMKDLLVYRKLPILTYLIIAVNAIILLLMTAAGGSENIRILTDFGALDPNLVLNKNEYYRLFSSMFLHIGFSHFIFNTFSLLVFGARLERYIPAYKFMLIYLFSGIFGGALTLLLSPVSIAAGASGAIFGLIGALMTYIRRKGAPIGGLSFMSMLMIIIVNLGLGFMQPEVGNAAHIGGLLIGIILGFSL